MNLEQKIEAILFYKNEPVPVLELIKVLEVTREEIISAIEKLTKSLDGRGISLIQDENEIALTTPKDLSELIEKIAKNEIEKDIGKAGLETLSIIMYNNGVSRREIDYIRGVNSYFVLRNLTMRGLIEKNVVNNVTKYKPTIKLLAHLGLSKIEDLPEFNEFQKSLMTIKEEKGDEQH